MVTVAPRGPTRDERLRPPGAMSGSARHAVARVADQSRGAEQRMRPGGTDSTMKA